MAVSVVQYHEIAESSHLIMNPFSIEKQHLLGEICGLSAGMRVLDLACGKGELLCGFARDFGTTGAGVDNHPPFVAGARARAEELGVTDLVQIVEGDAGDAELLATLGPPFDVVACIGATWIGGGPSGTFELMRRQLGRGAGWRDGWVLVGEVYWMQDPPPGTRRRHDTGEGFADLAGTLDRFEAAGLSLFEMVLANLDDWDRYAASQWLNVERWISANPGHPDAGEVRALRDQRRREYLAEDRGRLGWGVFVLRA